MGRYLQNYNVSHKYRFLLWLPERTGSRTIATILSHFDFKNNQLPIYDGRNYAYTHGNYIPKELEDYKIICSARNPYGRVLSIYKTLHNKLEIKNQENFKNFIKNKFVSPFTLGYIENPSFSKIPDYILRLENIKEDLMKLPFITEALNEKKIDYLTTHGKNIESWDEYYDQEMKDIVYKQVEKHFEVWGYKK